MRPRAAVAPRLEPEPGRWAWAARAAWACSIHSRGTYPAGTGPGGRAGGPVGAGTGSPGSVSDIGKDVTGAQGAPSVQAGRTSVVTGRSPLSRGGA